MYHSGCAFVTFADRESASAAICRLHQSQVMVVSQFIQIIRQFSYLFLATWECTFKCRRSNILQNMKFVLEVTV